MAEREQALLVRGFVLHQRAYRNTSQLLECLTETYGRVILVAQGTKRGLGSRRALLQPFTPLTLSWLRRGELGRLTHVEAEGAGYDLPGQHVLAGFYANELVLRLLARGDPNGDVFSCYSRCLAQLGAHGHVARTLRLFELQLLHALGYGLELTIDTETGEPLQGEAHYLFELERGPRIAGPSSRHDETYSGRELIALHEQTLADDASLRAAQRLLGRALKTYLGERPLRSRLVLQDIVSRGL
jgi:DNA repair protein RecO (recombination protein O)